MSHPFAAFRHLYNLEGTSFLEKDTLPHLSTFLSIKLCKGKIWSDLGASATSSRIDPEMDLGQIPKA